MNPTKQMIFYRIPELDGLGQTGEFYAAKRDKNGDALLIISLRFVSDAPLNFKVSKNEVHTPIVQATILKKEKILTDTLDGSVHLTDSNSLL